MRRLLILLFVVIAVMMGVTGWSGEERLALLGPRAHMDVARVALDARDPRRRTLGGLTFLGGVSLRSRDPAFGGFSSLSVRGDRFTLLSDGGNVVAFRMGADWQPRDLSFANLPGGPGTGWEKRDRDSESMAVDPGGRIWVGFEGWNAIWRYAPGFARAERAARPAEMAKWPVNGGPETLVRLRDGRFLTISETRRPESGGGRVGLVFPGDPTSGAVPYGFVYVPPAGYDPSDATELPGGRLLVVNRGFSLPYAFSNVLSIVPAGAVRPGARVKGRDIAKLDAPLIHDNFEGVAATREGNATILWIVSDDNQSTLQRSLLLKFRLDS